MIRAAFLRILLAFATLLCVVVSPGLASADTAEELRSMLARSHKDADALRNDVAQLVASAADPVAAARTVLASLAGADREQLAAVGEGLAGAVSIIAASNSDAALALTALVGDADRFVQAAFNAATMQAAGDSEDRHGRGGREGDQGDGGNRGRGDDGFGHFGGDHGSGGGSSRAR